MFTGLPTDYQSFIHASRYARYRDDLGRRETWEETVHRYFDHFEMTEAAPIIRHYGREYLQQSILTLKTMPSMRALMTAGPALARCNIAGYNCAYLPVDNPLSFDETLYILLCGTGVGYSVERQYVSMLPAVPARLVPSDTTIVVEDSKEGWALGLRQLVAALYAGVVPKWDTSRVRPAGARLVTFGGRASGPGPLEDLFRFTIKLFKEAAGRRLESIECHDLMCKIAEIVVVGGVRRAAMISFSNLSDERMQKAKSGQWWIITPHRGLANNSYCATQKPDVGVFMQEWNALYESKSGERGIFNREAARKQAAKYGRRDPNHEFGSNPCCEIILRPYQFCNLTEVVCREDDDFGSLCKKIEVATVLGTIQSTMTKLPYLREIWTKNTEEERLLGVSLTGIMDSRWLMKASERDLNSLREVAVAVNGEAADLIGIPRAAAVTCVKPSGTVSQLVDSSSGIHPRFAEHYVRRVRGDNKDPMTTFMKSVGIPHEPERDRPDDTTVFEFPMKAPADAPKNEDISAIQHLEMWLKFQNNWCEHKPSITIMVRNHEWPSVGAWVWEHFDQVSGIAFLPYDDSSYQQAPYEAITQQDYEDRVAKMPQGIDWKELAIFEEGDQTVSSQTPACVGGSCEIVDIVRG